MNWIYGIGAILASIEAGMFLTCGVYGWFVWAVLFGLVFLTSSVEESV